MKQYLQEIDENAFDALSIEACLIINLFQSTLIKLQENAKKAGLVNIKLLT